jgi:hypothetical protein
LPELIRTPQLRWRVPNPVLATLIAKSSWLPATYQDPQGQLRTGTSKTSPQTSCLLMHLQTRPPPTGTLDVSVTGSATNGAGVSETTSPSATLRKLSRRLREEYTLPPSNASCRSQLSRLREYVLEKSSPSSLKTLTSCGSTTESTSLPPLGTVTTKLQVAALTLAATVLEPSSRLSLTVLVQTAADPHRVATATARSSLTAPPAAAAETLVAGQRRRKLQPRSQQEGRRRRQSRRSRPREQPRLRSLTGRPRRPPED